MIPAILRYFRRLALRRAHRGNVVTEYAPFTAAEIGRARATEHHRLTPSDLIDIQRLVDSARGGRCEHCGTRGVCCVCGSSQESEAR